MDCKSYKAILIDVDKTLISSPGGLPSVKVQHTIQQATKYVHVALATGKPYSQLMPIIESLKLTGPSIASGGGQIVNVATGTMYAEYPMDFETTFKISKVLLSNNNNFWIQDNGIDYQFTSNYQPSKPMAIIVHDVSSSRADEILITLSDFTDIATFKVSLYNSNNFDIHISSIHATKQQGVFHLAQILNINTEEIIGIGDSYNDFPLLLACGLKVAMGNAVDDLKAIADYVCADVEHDGVAEVIEKFIL